MDSVGLNEASAKDTHPRKGEAYLDRENATFQDAKVGRTVPAAVEPRSMLCNMQLSTALFARLAPCVPAVDGKLATGLFERLR